MTTSVSPICYFLIVNKNCAKIHLSNYRPILHKARYCQGKLPAFSFQLGTVILAGCPSVRAINRSTSGFRNALVFCCCCVTALRRVTLPHLLASYKRGLLYVLTVFPAESWAKSCLSVRPSVCNVEISWSYSLEFLKNYNTAD